MKNKRLFIFIVPLLSLAMAACSIHSTTDIKADGSGEINVRFAFTEEDIDAVEEEKGEDLEDLLAADFGDGDMGNACEELANEREFPSNATAEYSESGGEFSCEISMTFADLDELIEIYEDMFLGKSSSIRMNADGELSYSIDLDSSDFTYDDLGAGENEYLWIVTAPGRIENHNADEKRGHTLTWDLSGGDFDSIEFDSVPEGFFSSITGSSSTWWVMGFAFLCLCAAILVVGSGVGFYFFNRKMKAAQEA